MTEAAATAPAPPKRLPPGRHGLSREQVRESQRRRLIAAATELLAEHGYGQVTITGVAKRAGVSTATFYKRFDDLWACLLVAYGAAAERLCRRIEGSCTATDGNREERTQAGITGGLALLASEPAIAYLLSAEPPSQASTIWAARLRLIDRLSAMLNNAHEPNGGCKREARLVGGALALVSIRARTDGPERLEDLVPALTELLLAS
jgi:AcrR family transcriptional regulator